MKNELKKELAKINFELVAHDNGIVLGYRANTNSYATWEYNSRGIYWGHYDMDKISAWADFVDRLKRVMI